MSSILKYSTMVLCLAGVVFSLVYIWLNTCSKIKDVEIRNEDILKSAKTSMGLSFVFAFLTCLLTNPDDLRESVKQASDLFQTIAISWILVALGCAVAVLIAFVSRSKYRKELFESMKKVFSTAITGAVAGTVLTWLLS